MGNSLQDQLLKAGLVDEQQIKQARSSKRKKVKQGGARQKPGDEGRRRAQQAAAEKARRDSELNEARLREARRKAEANELRQLIHTNRIPRGDGDVAYSFQDGGSVKRIYVTADQKTKLASGRLAIVRQDTGYELVLSETAERVRARNTGLIVVLNRPEEDSNPDDEYAGYEVPDDLMW